MRYEAKDYGRLMVMDGFSDDSLENHFSLYRGYVTHTIDAFFRNIRLWEVGGRLAHSYGRPGAETARIRPESGRG